MIDLAYETLRLDKTAGPEEIRRAYVRLVRRYPPEHFPDKFARIHEAYRRLTLDEDFVVTKAGQIISAESLLQLAGLIWGDHRCLREKEPAGLEGLASLLSAGPARPELDELLAEIDPAAIKWRK